MREKQTPKRERNFARKVAEPALGKAGQTGLADGGMGESSSGGNKRRMRG